jgi:AcrR family transcriptional regulator
MVFGGMESRSETAVAVTASQRARRDRIVQAAVELLDDRAYDRIQVKDVAESAHVALGTLYRYFPSKEQLFAEALLAWSRGFETSVRTTSRATSDEQRLARLLRRAVAAFERHPHFFQLITVFEGVPDPAVAAPFQEYSDRFGLVLAESLRDTAPEDALVITRLLAAFLGSLLRSWSAGQLPIASVYDQLERAVRIVFSAPEAART